MEMLFIIFVSAFLLITVVGFLITGGALTGVTALIGLMLRKAAAEEAVNNAAPIVEVRAVVKVKRTNVSGYEHSSTHCYITFELESGERRELHVSGREYGQLADGDVGMLRLQGTRYLGFARDIIG